MWMSKIWIAWMIESHSPRRATTTAATTMPTSAISDHTPRSCRWVMRTIRHKTTAQIMPRLLLLAIMDVFQCLVRVPEQHFQQTVNPVPKPLPEPDLLGPPVLPSKVFRNNASTTSAIAKSVTIFSRPSGYRHTHLLTLLRRDSSYGNIAFRKRHKTTARPP